MPLHNMREMDSDFSLTDEARRKSVRRQDRRKQSEGDAKQLGKDIQQLERRIVTQKRRIGRVSLETDDPVPSSDQSWFYTFYPDLENKTSPEESKREHRRSWRYAQAEKLAKERERRLEYDDDDDVDYDDYGRPIPIEPSAIVTDDAPTKKAQFQELQVRYDHLDSQLKVLKARYAKHWKTRSRHIQKPLVPYSDSDGDVEPDSENDFDD